MTQPDEARLDDPTPDEQDAIVRIRAAGLTLTSPVLRESGWTIVLTDASGIEVVRTTGAPSRELALVGAIDTYEQEERVIA